MPRCQSLTLQLSLLPTCSVILSNLWLFFLFVQQCGNFAVLVDLHVLPQGPKASTDWFTATQTEVIAHIQVLLVNKCVCLHKSTNQSLHFNRNLILGSCSFGSRRSGSEGEAVRRAPPRQETSQTQEGAAACFGLFCQR